jgi:hypothetical protein
MTDPEIVASVAGAFIGAWAFCYGIGALVSFFKRVAG